MREIKFRAWNKARNIMCYGNEDNTSDYWDGVQASDVEMINNRLKDGNYIFMQFVGLKDKNENEAYEGDEVKHPTYGMFVIEWDDEEALFFLRDPEFNMNDEDAHFNMWELRNAEIVGNIYDRKEVTK